MDRIAGGVYKFVIGSPEEHTPVSVLKPQPRLAELAALPDLPCPMDKEACVWSVTPRALTIELPLDPEEDLYGLGLQMKSFRQTGRKKLLRSNSDPTSDTGDSHAPVPFLASTAGYALLVDTARHTAIHAGNCKRVGGRRDRFASAGTETGHWEIKSGAGNLLIDIPGVSGVTLYLFCGPALRDAVCRYNLFSGGGALPPLWGLGNLYRGDWHAGQDATLALAKSLREDGIPCDTYGLEPGWQTHAYSSTYVWDRVMFPDPENFCAEMKRMGYKVNLWEQPYVHPKSPIFDAMKPHSGDYYVWDGLVPDFSQNVASACFASHHDGLVEMGVDGFKLDECDNSDFTSNWGFPDFSVFPSGMDGMQMHGLFGPLYQKTMLAPFEKRGLRTFGQVRHSGACAAPFPYGLYSDLYDHTDFIRGMASAAMSGLMWSPEVRQTESEDELLRRLQAVVLAPQAVINCFMLPMPPWKQYDYEKNLAGEKLPDHTRLTALCRDILSFRMRLIPHLYTAFYRYYLTGLPPVRPLVMDVPEDPAVRDIYDEFMIGDGLLAAPRVYGRSERNGVYLPEGIWYDFHTGTRLAGGRRVAEPADSTLIPLYVREGTLLALAEPEPFIRTDTLFRLELRAYGIETVSCLLYEDDGYSLSYREGEYRTVTLRLTGETLALEGGPLERYSVERIRRFTGQGA